jgi:protein subunit release factor B
VSFPVSAATEAELRARMERLGIREEDVEEEFVRGGGAGGQKINKTSSTVVLRHRGLGIEVRCARERSQAMNRFFARRMLCEKVAEKTRAEKSEAQRRREKIRRQKRRKSARQRAIQVEEKRRHGEKKSMRRKPGADE